MELLVKDENVTRVLIDRKADHPDPKEVKLLKAIRQYLHLDIDAVKILRSYAIVKHLNQETVETLVSELLIDPVVEERFKPETLASYHWMIRVSFKQGVTDNAGKTAQLTIEDYLDSPFLPGERVESGLCTLLRGSVDQDSVRIIAEELLANPLIQNIEILSLKKETDECTWFDLNRPDTELVLLSKKRQLALSLKEMKAIQAYFQAPEVKEKRRELALPEGPTDVELEALAQTWSEHCKHKIFRAKIRYTCDGETEIIESLFSSFIKKATEDLSGSCPWLVSVFSDNAGIIRFTDKYNLAFKVETHNSPSALDPYGGALTGILGVNRDIMGAGLGARLVANTNVLCFAPPKTTQAIPKKLLHPKRVFEGVRLGIEHGGNKSGVPTVNGSLVFDEGYLGKPLVYCGTVGIMPTYINGFPTHIKEIRPGDLIVIAGGRTGKDGIHGATFSSEELHEASPSSAVQIGDPFTQKKLHDFLIEARDLRLFRAVTDNGAGGFSSSVGELAELSGGCEIHLDRALLKHSDCEPWEILLSESQERMTFAVDPENMQALIDLSRIHEIELCEIGSFTDSGYFHVIHKRKNVAFLELEFFHHGLPPLELEARFVTTEETLDPLPQRNLQSDLHALLGRLNICSKEWIVRQYDHEVQGGSVLKPFVGDKNEGPSDASITRPLEVVDESVGFALSHGICPRYSDGYHMAACAVDEAVRGCVAVGADPKHLALLDNFCWPDPIYDPEKTPDGKEKCGALVRANQALYDLCMAYRTPLISGKDSMKNDYKIGSTKISIKPTLLVSAIAKVPDITKTVSMDVKAPGDLVYVLGVTKNEMKESEYAALIGYSQGATPKVDPEKAIRLYRLLHLAIQKELIASCHDCSDGGLGVALAESAFSGGLGMDISLQDVPTLGALTCAEILFSETPSRFVVTIAAEKQNAFESIMKEVSAQKIGKVRKDGKFTVIGKNHTVLIDEEIEKLKASWQETLKVGP